MKTSIIALGQAMQIDVITLFPKMIEALFSEGVIGRAIDNGQVSINCINPRQFASGVHQAVDDRPYGGGPGMVMSCEVLDRTFAELNSQADKGFHVYLSPQGKQLNQRLVKKLSKMTRLVLLCGRYEGVDERIISEHIDLECSIGDYVLSGGELAAAVVIDSVVRQLPGVLGHEESADNDSFANGLLDHPHYTRPENYKGEAVPDTLLSGNHQKIDDYRHKQALGNTWIKRPDLFAGKTLSAKELQLLNEYIEENKS